MSRYATIIAVALSLATTSCRKSQQEPASEPASTGMNKGELLGIQAVSNRIKERMLDATDTATLNFRVTSVVPRGIATMNNLLGDYVKSGTGTEFVGGRPNAFGIMLWHQTLGFVATATASYCANPGTDKAARTVMISGADADVALVLEPSFAASLAAVCQLPDDATTSQSQVRALWYAVMGFTAPLEEDSAYTEFFSREFRGKGQERAFAMLMAVFLNPYYLLVS